MARFYYKGSRSTAASPNSDLHGFGDEIRKELAGRIPRERLKVLDVGTGFGMNAAFLAGHLPRGSLVWTVDPSKEVLEEVEADLSKRGLRGLKFVEATADSLPFEDGSFDAVVSVMVLHHVEELGPALKEMWRVLKTGGNLILVDYKPEASRELEFKARHDAEDFFSPAAVAEEMAALGIEPEAGDFRVWYVVSAVKRPSALRRPGRAGHARRRAVR
ncbi:MAG: class I SAM-dependent methyltransferase [Nitrososphaerota archaeon]|nr:class I SAM-dependent methyltransferase [Nitrososphaerota archaeon]MDG7021950.1 class I SAM-dependent methyltransferase [Nitrososphaerota archaeon]